MRDHRKLRAFDLADELVIMANQVTMQFPGEEKHGLTSQIRRAAISVPSNIVEGCARSSQAEYIQFLNVAFGSLRELHYQLDISHRLGFLKNIDYVQIEKRINEAEKVLHSLIRALRTT